MNVRVATLADVSQVVGLHQRCLPQEFLSRLGAGALKHIYPAFLNPDIGFLLVAEIDQQVVGFVAGAWNTGKLFRRVLQKRWLPLTMHGCWHLCRHPADINKIFAALLYPNKNSSLSLPELISIAVAPEQQKKGVGKQLLQQFNVLMRGKGHKQYFLIVGAENAQARAFYRQADFHEEATLESMQRHFVRMTKEVLS